MPEYAPLDLPDYPKLTHNITHFARALRKAGVPAGPGRVIDAIRAVKAAGLEGKVLVAGFDNISAIRPLVESGTVVATADQHADKLAVFGIEAALGIVSGEAPPENRKTAVDLVTP